MKRGLDADQRNPEIIAPLAAQIADRFGNGHFQRRPHFAGQEMTAAYRTVGKAERRMKMEAAAAPHHARRPPARRSIPRVRRPARPRQRRPRAQGQGGDVEDVVSIGRAAWSTITSFHRRDGMETRHRELTERKHVIAVALPDLHDFVHVADGEDVGSQGVVDAADEAGHALATHRGRCTFRGR
jgi:hypothetical protein